MQNTPENLQKAKKFVEIITKYESVDCKIYEYPDKPVIQFELDCIDLLDFKNSCVKMLKDIPEEYNPEEYNAIIFVLGWTEEKAHYNHKTGVFTYSIS